MTNSSVGNGNSILYDGNKFKSITAKGQCSIVNKLDELQIYVPDYRFSNFKDTPGSLLDLVN